ncbi:MAG TPA: hypothetical protein VKT52_04680 [Ktedonobacterales bacterium]|nr:hypothetical protein [Ktedonobacterales bacterium]
MPIDWRQLALELGSLDELHLGREAGGIHYAERALEKILGDDTIHDTVYFIVDDGGPGAEVATNVLQHIMSLSATELAYEIYKSSTGLRASFAVMLIKRIAHPRAVEWIKEFLEDDNVAVWGVGVLDQLLWCSRVEPEAVENLLVLAEHHPIENVREQAQGIRSYLAHRLSD